MRRLATPSLFVLLLVACQASVSAQGTRASAPPPPRTTAAAPSEGVPGYYRQPALHGDTIVFAGEGDLWVVSVAGGVARRLTTHPGEETDPALSPDGTTLAFTARYEGPAEVYTMPLAGGTPTRATYEADTSTVRTWTPDGKLVYETRRFSGLPRPGLVALDVETMMPSPLPLSYCANPTFDAAGTTTWFVRPAWHRNVTKRYTGGTARDVWKFTTGSEEAIELTGDYDGESHSPMWWDGRVYFVTDRDGTMNLWSMDEDGGDLRQHTRHSAFDVREPALHAGRIVYQRAADLWLYDIAADQTRRVPITLASDLDQLRERWVDEPMQSLQAAHLHPKGESVVLTSRGRVFVAPAQQGRLVRASRKDGVRFRDVTFLPGGDALVGLTDESGELELTRLPANGVGADEPLTSDGTILRFEPTPSPDGRWIAYHDNNHDLWVLDVEAGKSRKINENREGVANLAWSPDGRWLAYRMTALNTFRRIVVFDTQEGTTFAVTSDRVNSQSPAWGPQGDFLYFLSDRNLRSLVSSPWGTRAPQPYFDKTMQVFLVGLRPGLRSPFRPDDELAPAAAREDGKQEEEEGKQEQDEPRTEPVEIEPAGIAGRVERVPLAAGNYRSLAVNRKALFLTARDSGPGARTHLVGVKIDNEDVEAKTMVPEVRAVEMSLDGKQLLVRKGQEIYVIDAKPGEVEKLGKHRVDLSGWSYSLDVRQDWRQIFVDAWRLERDYFYDPGMHGLDWDAVLARYLPLVERVTTRDELSHLIGCLVGELSALHTSVRGGDLRQGPDQVSVATLGARMFRDPAAGGYRIDYVFQSDPDYPDERAPLAEPHLDVHAGDVIEAVNGTSTLDVFDIGALLRHQQGKQVLLRVKSGGKGATPAGESRDLIVVPDANELNLRYADWEYTRRLRVEEESDGKIGYLHLRAMGGSNITEFFRNFYPVFDRPGLIVDVRSNRGGNIDSFILSRLMRKAWMYWQGRQEQPTWNMQYAFRGHMVVLVDQLTASDGEAFADGFRRLGLGPVIGMRTWGGEIWLSSDNRLSDGGIARAPMSGVYGPEGEWLIEQIGVVPDMEVDNLPHATFRGADAQLDAAIEYLLGEIEKDPRPVPPPPPYPDRSFDYPEEGR